MGGLFGGFGGFMAFAATVLLIIVSVSTPIWNSVYFLRSFSGGDVLKLGNWGACIEGAQTVCTSRRLGYDYDDLVRAVAGQDALGDVSGTITKGLTYALILHPIAAAFSLVAFLLAVCPNIVTHILGSIVAFLATLITLVVFAIDLALFIVARNRINDNGGDARLGNAVWLVLGALVALLIASFTICCAGISDRRKNRRASQVDNSAYGYNEKRGPFWRRRRTAVV